MVFSMFCMKIQIWGTGFNFGGHIFDISLIYRPESWKGSLNFAHGLEQFCRLSEVAINNIITQSGQLKLLRGFDDQPRFQFKSNFFLEYLKHTSLDRIWPTASKNKNRQK